MPTDTTAQRSRSIGRCSRPRVVLTTHFYRCPRGRQQQLRSTLWHSKQRPMRAPAGFAAEVPRREAPCNYIGVVCPAWQYHGQRERGLIVAIGCLQLKRENESLKLPSSIRYRSWMARELEPSFVNAGNGVLEGAVAVVLVAPRLTPTTASLTDTLPPNV